MKTVFQYTSVHEYLDEVFSDVLAPTHQQIADAKKRYWRLYLDAYQQKRRSRIKEFTLGFDTEKMQVIHQKRNALSVSEFLYHCVFNALETEALMEGKLLQTIHANQLEIITVLEELLEQKDDELTESYLEKMEMLELQILELKCNGD